MSWKRGLLLACISTILASIACLIYNKIYSEAFYVDFSKVINATSIISTCLATCTLMTTGYILVSKWKGKQLLPWANVAYGIISFASIAGVMSFNLPLDIEFPEMFPGLTIPMHFFPLLSFMTVYSFFRDTNGKNE